MAPIGLKCFPITPWRGVIRVLWKARKKIRVWVFYLEEEIGRSLPRHVHGCERKQDCWELDAFQLNISVNIHIHVREYVCLRSRICGKRMCTYLDTYVYVSLRNRTSHSIITHIKNHPDIDCTGNAPLTTRKYYLRGHRKCSQFCPSLPIYRNPSDVTAFPSTNKMTGPDREL